MTITTHSFCLTGLRLHSPKGNNFEQVTFYRPKAWDSSCHPTYGINWQSTEENLKKTYVSQGKVAMSNLAPGYPSEYLLTRHEPNASNTARLVKFWQQQS